MIMTSSMLSAGEPGITGRFASDYAGAARGRLRERHDAAARVAGTGLPRNGEAGPPLAWPATHVTTFAWLLQDGAAVKAALTTPWSSGQTEGQVGKPKRLRRQTFGRASFDRLRRRVLLAA